MHVCALVFILCRGIALGGGSPPILEMSIAGVGAEIERRFLPKRPATAAKISCPILELRLVMVYAEIILGSRQLAFGF